MRTRGWLMRSMDGADVAIAREHRCKTLTHARTGHIEAYYRAHATPPNEASEERLRQGAKDILQ